MSEIDITISWPESTVPLPYIDASGAPRHSSIASDTTQSLIVRRLRFSGGRHTELKVEWVLSIAQFFAFKTLFDTTLSMGAALFKIELKYPKQSELTEWVARFVGGYDAEYLDGNWRVSAVLDLILPVDLPEVDAGEGYAGYYVEPEESGGEYMPYITSDGFHYHVIDE